RCVCGAASSDRDDEGFCQRCGRKHRLALATDHMEESSRPELAAVGDRGLRHERNEDRFGIVQRAGGYGLVVCDGVSSSRASEIASAAVADGVCNALAAALDEDGATEPERVVREAIRAGALRLEEILRRESGRSSRRRRGEDDNPPSTTVVAALVTGGRCTVGWLGDSRAYWFGEDGARMLTRDHSWQNEVVSAGTMSAEEAARSPRAHAITRWVGPDADGMDAEVVTFTLAGSGVLMLCSDGLWNYAASVDEMKEQVMTRDDHAEDALEGARRLVRFALEQGGQDNITVAMLQVGMALESAAGE
ncbi:MAG: PP2C family protein-serine/threonine phosphatase, partial [Janthinobacterium lividum]